MRSRMGCPTIYVEGEGKGEGRLISQRALGQRAAAGATKTGGALSKKAL